MITFEKLRIQRYKAIRDATYVYDSGIFKVNGKNLDTAFESNGSAKSTLLQALSQCLYNKAPSTSSISDTVYQHSTVQGEGYILTLNFNKNGDQYIIVNDRRRMLVQVVKNDIQISPRGIPGTLRLIQSIIGVDYDTFNALTYLSSESILTLLSDFTKSALVKSVLNIDMIADIDKNLKVLLKDKAAELTTLNAKVHTITDTIKALSTFDLIDIVPYKEKLSELLFNSDKLPQAMLRDIAQQRYDKAYGNSQKHRPS
jgi:DNA repair exonuclease SbcCD ATPase subunit